MASLTIVFAACGGGGSKASSAPTVPAAKPDTGAATAPAPSASPAAAGAPGSCGEGNPGSKLTSVQRSGTRSFKAAPERVIDPDKSYTAVIQTSKGEIKLHLAAKDVPNTTNNFVFLACDGFYDGLIFHRVVLTPQPFVIQGGDPRGDGSGGPGYLIPDEFNANWKHVEGALAMANAGPNTNGSQFYITLAPQPALDNKYSVFGKVTAGMDVVRAIRMGDKIVRVDIIES
jgi:peptidyl-prolyl cis-trans isomerase B (cyclophilin B)